MRWFWLQRLIISFSFFSFGSWSSNNYHFFNWRAILCIRLSSCDFFEDSFLLSPEKFNVIENTIVFFLIFIIILRVNRWNIDLLRLSLSLAFIRFDNSINYSFQVAHNSTLFLNLDKNFSKDRVHSIFGDFHEIFLEEGRKVDIWVVDTDLGFDLRINIANLRYMC